MTDFSWTQDRDQVHPRAVVQAAFEQRGYTFSAGLLPTNQRGRPRGVGETSDRRSRVELIGPPEAVFKATLVLDHPGDNAEMKTRAWTELVGFLAVVMSDWHDGPTWLAAQWPLMTGKHRAETRFRNLHVSLRSSGDGSRVVFGVTWQPHAE